MSELFKKEDLILESCEPPEIVEMTAEDIEKEKVLIDIMFGRMPVPNDFTFYDTCGVDSETLGRTKA